MSTPLVIFAAAIALTSFDVVTPADPRSVWPLAPPPHVLRAFAPPPEPWLPGHRGVDLAGRAGDPVLAAGAGVVSFAGPVGGRGVVVIRHDAAPTPIGGFPATGLRTTYEPVVARLPSGRRVRAGEVIGWIQAGSMHCGPGRACLHWGLRHGEQYLDPLLLVRPAAVRLLPIDGSPVARSGASGLGGTGPVGTGRIGTGPVGTGPVGFGPVGFGPVDPVAGASTWPAFGQVGAVARVLALAPAIGALVRASRQEAFATGRRGSTALQRRARGQPIPRTRGSPSASLS